MLPLCLEEHGAKIIPYTEARFEEAKASPILAADESVIKVKKKVKRKQNPGKKRRESESETRKEGIDHS